MDINIGASRHLCSASCCEIQPNAIHWKAALGILEYIKGTSEYAITYQREKLVKFSLKVLADPDYASAVTDRRLVSSGAIMYGGVCVC